MTRAEAVAVLNSFTLVWPGMKIDEQKVQVWFDSCLQAIPSALAPAVTKRVIASSDRFPTPALVNECVRAEKREREVPFSRVAGAVEQSPKDRILTSAEAKPFIDGLREMVAYGRAKYAAALAGKPPPPKPAVLTQRVDDYRHTHAKEHAEFCRLCPDEEEGDDLW